MESSVIFSWWALLRQGSRGVVRRGRDGAPETARGSLFSCRRVIMSCECREKLCWHLQHSSGFPVHSAACMAEEARVVNNFVLFYSRALNCREFVVTGVLLSIFLASFTNPPSSPRAPAQCIFSSTFCAAISCCRI